MRTQVVPDKREFVAKLMGLQPRLRAYVRATVFDANQVDDIVQSIAMGAWEKLDSYDPDRPFDAWLFGIARNRVLEYLRKSRRDRHWFNDELVTQLSDEYTEMGEGGDASRLDALQECLDRLPPREREVVVRRHQKGVTGRNMAQELGYSESKFSRWINRLYMQLMMCMEAPA